MTQQQVIIPFSNLEGDRIYQNLYGTLELINKNGRTYNDSIETKSIKLKSGSLSYVYKTKDNRWFDKTGMPIEQPKNLVTRDKNTDD